ncbi:AGAP000190-PA-like protein [Anopheles sinensis]|uniref:AGAP000190-PA-like protein n=1 Tax=Anopheles sinensis TaxID=74873 RepID=A0A084WPW3_ANOSI|nr:AGAP000190-PA-like protein [Anopheles sinensis]
MFQPNTGRGTIELQAEVRERQEDCSGRRGGIAVVHSILLFTTPRPSSGMAEVEGRLVCSSASTYLEVWFKNRRAKWRKRERNQMNAIAAADFKNGFGPQFVQPFADTDTLYSSYSYNNWAKVPSPLGAKTFPWTVNPLGTSIVSSNHHQNSINCFNTSASSVAAGMAGTGTMLPASMGTGLTGTTGATGVSPTPCPYTTPANPYMYHHRATAEPCTAMSSSIATLRLKAKQHTSGFSSPYSAPSPVSRSNSASLSACQYAGVTDSV